MRPAASLGRPAVHLESLHRSTRRPMRMPANASRDLTRGPFGRTLFVFALPILGGNVLQSLNGSVNAIWVGRFLGEEALTATANANNIMFFLIGAVFGVGMAATILDRKSVVSGQSVSVRVDLGGRRLIKKKKQINHKTS